MSKTKCRNCGSKDVSLDDGDVKRIAVLCSECGNVEVIRPKDEEEEEDE